MPAATRSSAAVQAVGRTMRTTELLADAPAGMTVAELARELGTDNSIASRVLSSLHALGYVARDEATDRYELSLKFASVAFRFTDRIGFPTLCLPVLHRLSTETGELTQLAAVEGEHLVYVANSPGSQRLTIVPTVGREVALHATASGKAWLANLPESEAMRIALSRGLEQVTPHTMTSIPQLLAEFAEVRRVGYAVAAGEFTEGVSAVATPIGMRRFGVVVGALVVSGPSHRFDEDVERLAPLVRAAADELETVWPANLARLAPGAQSARAG